MPWPLDPARAGILDDATAIFFTGGDQVKIATKLGGTPLLTRLRERFSQGALVSGTSAGASAMGEAMLASRPVVLLGDCWPPLMKEMQRHLAVSEDDLGLLDFATTPEEAVAIIERKSGAVVV